MDPLGNCSLTHQHCPDCKTRNKDGASESVSIPVGDLYEGQWCKTVHTVCDKKWYVCIGCKSNKKQTTNSDLLQRHYKEFHVKDQHRRTSHKKKVERESAYYYSHFKE
jgi:hypothetical protein